MKNLEQEVRARRLDALLEDAVGGGASPDLAVRVLARLRAQPVRRRRSTATWLAAACMFAGIAVVVATALGRQANVATASAQDPKPGEVRTVTVTTAMVKAACVPVDAPPPGDGVERLLALANRGPFGIVVAPGVQGESKADLEGLTWHEAVASIAAELKVGVAEFGTMVVVGAGAVPGESGRRWSHKAYSPSDVRELPRLLHRFGGVLDIVCADDVAGQVSLETGGVPTRAILEVVAEQLGLQVVGCGSVLALRRAVPAPAPDRVLLNFKSRPIGEVIDTWAKLARGNVVIAPEVQGVISIGTLKPVTADLLAALGAAVGADVQHEDRGILRFVPRLPLPASVTLTAEQVTPRMVAETTGVPPELVSFANDADRRVGVTVDQVPAFDLLWATAVATGRTFARADQGYTIR